MISLDIKIAGRLLLRQPLYTLSAVTVLAIGIGANTAIFSLVDQVLLRPLPYPDAGRMVVVWKSSAERQMPQAHFSAPEYTDLAARATSFTSLSANRNYAASWTGEGPPLRLTTQIVTPNFFQTLGVAPTIGRGFLPEEGVYGKSSVVILGEAFWKRGFGGRAVLGQRITLDNELHEIVGIFPDLKDAGRSPDIFVPAAFSPKEMESRDSRYLTVTGRLKQGVSPQTATEELNSLVEALGRQYPESDAGWRVYLEPAHEEVVGRFRRPLLILFIAVALLLVIACFNLINLTLVRAATRKKEFAIRMAVGAGRGRVLLQLIVENVMLALAGGLVGVLLGWALFSAIKNWTVVSLPRLRTAEFDLRAFAFAIGIATAAGVLFGTLPALRARRINLAGVLREETRGGTSGSQTVFSRWALVVGELALSAALLTCAGLLVKTMTSLAKVNPGFNAEGVITCRVTLPNAKYPEHEHSAAYVRRAIERIEAIPGVSSAGMTTALPLMQVNWIATFAIEGRPDLANRKLSATYNAVSPEYLDTIGVPLLRGRGISPRDDARAPSVVIISRSMEKTWFNGRDAVGQHLLMQVANHKLRSQIIGVVEDAKHLRLDEAPRPAIYQPHAQLPWPFLAFAVKSSLPVESLEQPLRRAFADVDSDVPIDRVRPLSSLVESTLSQQRLAMTLLAAFSLIALLLTAVGLYGVLSLAVAQRTRELGVRAALGATPGDLMKLVFRDGLIVAFIGIAAGLAFSPLATRSLKAMLYGVEPVDPLTMLAVAVVLLAVSAAAIAVPSIRASRVDPAIALRNS